MNTIVIEFCPEDRARLDAIISGLERLAPAALSSVSMDRKGIEINFDSVPASDQAPMVSIASGIGVAVGKIPADDPVADLPADDPAPAADPAPAPMSLEEFQKAVTVRCAESPETKKAVRALVKKYAASVSTIPEDKRSEFLTELAKI